VATSDEIRRYLEDCGLPQHGATPLELVCGFCEERHDRVDLREKPRRVRTVWWDKTTKMDGPQLQELYDWLLRHYQCKAKKEAGNLDFQVQDDSPADY
jgi:hypothetical protein